MNIPLSRIRELLPLATPDEKAELDALIAGYAAGFWRRNPSFEEFLRDWVYIQDADEETGDPVVKFDPWLWQLELARAFPFMPLVIFLKGRQLGITWFCAAYIVWKALSNPGSRILLLSQGEKEAAAFLERVVFIFENLHPAMLPKKYRATEEFLKIFDTRTAVQAMPSTQKAGRSYTATLVVCDEHAQHPYAAANFAAVYPAAEKRGQLILVSTAHGVGNLFQKTWKSAVANVNKHHDLRKKGYDRNWFQPGPDKPGKRRYSFGNQLDFTNWPRRRWIPIFLPYYMHPGRDEKWWKETQEAMPEPEKAYQEYPRNPREAFLHSGNPYFSPKMIGEHEALVEPAMPQDAWPAELLVGEADWFIRRAGKKGARYDYEDWTDTPVDMWFGGALRIWNLPDPNGIYLGGSDVAEGLKYGDYDATTIMDVRTMEVVATLMGKWDTDIYAQLIDRLARVYRGMYGVERNNHGHAVLQELKRLQTPGIYREKPVYNKVGQKVNAGKIGWYTNNITKPLASDDLRTALRTHLIRIKDQRIIDHLYAYREENGRLGAPEGENDDLVVSTFICLQMAKHHSQEPGQAEVSFNHPGRKYQILG